MSAGNPIESISEAMYKALLLDLPEVEYKSQTPQQRRDGLSGTTKTRRPRIDEVEIYSFPQTWGSTALGFGGMGGASITSAYTTVVIDQHNNACVYFGGGFAYRVPLTNIFWKDVREFNVAEVSKCHKYYKKDEGKKS